MERYMTPKELLNGTYESIAVGWYVSDGRKYIMMNNGFTLGMISDEDTEQLIARLQREADMAGMSFNEIDYDAFMKNLLRKEE